MKHSPQIDEKVLIDRLNTLGNIGRTKNGELARLALSDEDRDAREWLCELMKDIDLKVTVDQIGNIMGTWEIDSIHAPLMIGSHIDSVRNAGIYDGSYGVLAGLSVIESLKKCQLIPDRSIIVTAFTNEEGARYTPDMMGSLVYAGGMSIDSALSITGIDGTVLGNELKRIGFSGDVVPGSLIPSCFLELHIEQGPILEAENTCIGVVENLQGISWQKIMISGTANHAGTTPINMRKDAGLAASRVNVFLSEYCQCMNDGTVATVGVIEHRPNIINVIPSRATFTVDIRNPDNSKLTMAENKLAEFLQEINDHWDVAVETQQLARFDPVTFDKDIVNCIEAVAERLGFSSKRMTSGAGHDAQMMSRISPAAMIFVPSKAGISHNPKECTSVPDLVQGAEVLLGCTMELTTTS